MKVGIIGGGITGLTTAIALGKKGFDVVVNEQAPELNEIGAGVWLQPNAIKILMELGLHEHVRDVGVQLNRVEITNSKLVPIKKIKGEIVQDQLGNKTIAIHRARLQKVLYDCASSVASVHLGRQYTTHSETDKGISVRFSDSEETFDIVLATDGVHSAVRQRLFKDTALRNTYQMCWRGIAPFKLPQDLQQLGREVWGRRIRFGFSQISAEEVYWFAVALEKDLPSNTEDPRFLSDLFRSFHPVVGELIRNTPVNAIHQTVLKDLARLRSWHKGRICLLGDAAHATTPNMGQGACQGMEDGFYMGRILESTSTIPKVFEDFTRKRRSKVDYVVNNSWRFGKMAHSPMGQLVLRFMMKITPESVMQRQMSRLYEVEGYSFSDAS